MGDNLREYIEEELGRIFDSLFEEDNFDKKREELEFDNYEKLVDEVWSICEYIKFESIVEIYENWIKSLEEVSNEIEVDIKREFDLDLEGDGRSKEDYIKDMEFILNSKEFMDYNIIDLIYENLGIEDKELILSCWEKWKLV